MIYEVLMGAGAVIWATGELWAFFSGRAKTDTTTAWVRLFEHRYLPIRILVGLFVIWLFLHFEVNLP